MERELPEGWVEVELSEINQEVSKVIPESTPDEYFNYIDIASVDNEKNIVTDAKSILGSDAPSRARQLVKKGDIVFSTVRTYLKNIAFITDKYDGSVASTGFAVIRPLDIIEGKFVFYYTLSDFFLEPLNQLQRGISYPAVKSSVVFGQSIPLPPLAEQRRIVAKLDEVFQHLDILKAKLERVPELLKNIRQAVLTQAVSGKLTDTDEYEITSLGNQLIDIKYGTSQKSDYEIDGVPVLRIPNIKDGEIDSTDLKFSILEEKDYEKLSLLEGDVLVIRSNGSLSIVGQSAIIRKDHERFAYAGYLIRLRTKQELDPEFLNLIFGSNYVRAQIIDKARSTTGVNNINTDELKSLNIPLPPLEEQREIVNRIKTLFAKVEIIEANYSSFKEKIDKLPQAILSKAFRGELLPQDPNHEPASALLNKIKETQMSLTRVEKRERPNNKKSKVASHMKKLKPVKSFKEFIDRLSHAGGSVLPSQLLVETSLEHDVDLFFDFLREGKSTGVLEVPIGEEGLIRLLANENR
ncbi:restriction endonuclease subunit S [Pontibacter sp. H259]|uniref:restriction endonuclease subunit S n=1 Tax=Pontibacter sp. H259 TaxID=3133421 RepID=UPI0030BA765E